MDNILKERYKAALNKLVLLDYDGTLVDFQPLPDRARPSDRLLNALRTIANQPRTTVTIISGRRHYDIDRFLGGLPLKLIAEHGAMVKEDGKWKKQVVDYGLWKRSVMPIFNRITLNCPNSFVEEKEFSLTWHYRNAQPEAGYSHSRELIQALENSARSFHLRIIEGDKIVEVMNRDIDKGKAINKVMEHNDYDYILSIGDDRTDEDMFRVLKNCTNAFTVKVGGGKTLAKYKLESVSEVLSLLDQLAN
jgi:trehalose 6-phosphate synthase/phosphatase